MSYSQVLKNSMVYSMLGFLPLATNIVLVPIYTRYLDPSEYGIIALANIFQLLMAIFVTLGLDGALSRYYFKYYRKRVLAEGLFSSILIMVLLVAALVIFLMHFLGQPLLQVIYKTGDFTYDLYGRYVLIGAVFTVIQGLFLIYYRNEENVRAFSWISISYFVLVTAGVFTGVVIFREGALGSIVGKMAGAVAAGISYLLFYYSRHRIRIIPRFYSRLFVYAFPLIPYLLLGILFDNIDRFVIERYFNLSVLGEYNFAYMIAAVLSIFIASMASTINPRVYKLLEDNPEKHRHEITIYFIFFHLVIVMLMLLGLAFVSPVVLHFIDESYHGVLWYLPLLFLAYIPRTYYYIYSIPLFFHLKTRIMPWINFISLLAGVLVYLALVPAIGLYGVCMGVITIKLIQFLLAAYYSRQFGEGKMFGLTRNHILSLSMAMTIGLAVVMLEQSGNLNLSVYYYLIPVVVNLPLMFILFRHELTKLRGVLKGMLR